MRMKQQPSTRRRDHVGRIVVTEYVSLDGVIEAPGGDEDYKYVVSSTLENPEWNNTTVLKGDAVEEVSKLRQGPGGDIVVHGSAQLVQTLLEHDLVDELRLMIYPVVLGTGKRLFGDTSDKKRLRLTDSKTVGDGITTFIYEPARREDEASEA
jgi:dihydrofolate reductase